jgi:hypothetical protein
VHGSGQGGSRRWAPRIAVLAVALLAPAPAAAGPHPPASDVVFARWPTSVTVDAVTLAGIHMAGVVRGEIGVGSYAGVSLGLEADRPGFWREHERATFHGGRHTFVADLHALEDDTARPASGVIQGEVTSGWMRGAQVSGTYTRRARCPIRTPRDIDGMRCEVGALHLYWPRR